MQYDFNTLKIRVSRAKDVPHLRNRAQALVDAIDNDLATTSTLESIILSDPALSARVLRATSVTTRNLHDTRFTTLHGAIMRLGFKAIRAIAISLSVQGFVEQTQDSNFFSTSRFARHSLFVAYMASHVFEQKLHAQDVESKWSPDEVLAAGIVHDIGDALFWMISPNDFYQVYESAREQQISFEQAFENLYQGSCTELSEALFKSWRLPDEFVDAVKYLRRPWDHPEKEPAIYAVHYANLLASASGFGKCEWSLIKEPTPEVAQSIGLSSQELQHAIGIITQIVNDQCDSVAKAS